MRTKIVAVIFVLSILVVLMSSSAECEVARGDTSSASHPDTLNLVWSHTTASQNNRYLIVSSMHINSSSVADSAFYNSVKMDVLYTHNHSNACGRIFGLAAPTVGTGLEVEIFYTGPLERAVAGIATSYYNVHQTADSATYDSIYSGRTSAGVLPMPADEGIDGDVGPGDWMHAFIGASNLQASSFVLGADQTLNGERLSTPSVAACYKACVGGADAITLEKITGDADCTFIAFVLNAAGAAVDELQAVGSQIHRRTAGVFDLDELRGVGARLVVVDLVDQQNRGRVSEGLATVAAAEAVGRGTGP